MCQTVSCCSSIYYSPYCYYVTGSSASKFHSKAAYSITLLSGEWHTGHQRKSEVISKSKWPYFHTYDFFISGQEVPLTLLSGKSHLLTHSSRMITSTAADFLALSSEPVSCMPHIALAALLRHRLRKAVKKPQHPTHCPHLALGYTFLHISVLTGKPIPNGEVTVPLINHFWAKQMENVHWCGHVNRHIPISICVYTKEKYAHFFILLNSPLNAKEFCILKSGLPQSMHSWQLFRESLALLSSAFSTIIWGWDI